MPSKFTCRSYGELWVESDVSSVGPISLIVCEEDISPERFHREKRCRKCPTTTTTTIYMKAQIIRSF